MLTVRFQGKEYLFVGDSIEEDGAIATIKQYRNGECSYAHLFTDGTIRRFKVPIGTRDDLEIVGESEVEEFDPLAAMFNTLIHPSWEGD